MNINANSAGNMQYFSTSSPFSKYLTRLEECDALGRPGLLRGAHGFYSHTSGLVVVHSGQELLLGLENAETRARGHMDAFTQQVAHTRQRLALLCSKTFKPIPKRTPPLRAFKGISDLSGEVTGARALLPKKALSATPRLTKARELAYEFEDLLSSVSPHSAFPLLESVKEAISCDFKSFQKRFDELSRRHSEKRAEEGAKLKLVASKVGAAQLTSAVFVRPERKKVTRESLIHQPSQAESRNKADASLATTLMERHSEAQEYIKTIERMHSAEALAFVQRGFSLIGHATQPPSIPIIDALAEKAVDALISGVQAACHLPILNKACAAVGELDQHMKKRAKKAAANRQKRMEYDIQHNEKLNIPRQMTEQYYADEGPAALGAVQLILMGALATRLPQAPLAVQAPKPLALPGTTMPPVTLLRKVIDIRGPHAPNTFVTSIVRLEEIPKKIFLKELPAPQPRLLLEGPSLKRIKEEGLDACFLKRIMSPSEIEYLNYHWSKRLANINSKEVKNRAIILKSEYDYNRALERLSNKSDAVYQKAIAPLKEHFYISERTFQDLPNFNKILDAERLRPGSPLEIVIIGAHSSKYSLQLAKNKYWVSGEPLPSDSGLRALPDNSTVVFFGCEIAKGGAKGTNFANYIVKQVPQLRLFASKGLPQMMSVEKIKPLEFSFSGDIDHNKPLFFADGRAMHLHGDKLKPLKISDMTYSYLPGGSTEGRFQSDLPSPYPLGPTPSARGPSGGDSVLWGDITPPNPRRGDVFNVEGQPVLVLSSDSLPAGLNNVTVVPLKEENPTTILLNKPMNVLKGDLEEKVRHIGAQHMQQLIPAIQRIYFRDNFSPAIHWINYDLDPLNPTNKMRPGLLLDKNPDGTFIALPITTNTERIFPNEVQIDLNSVKGKIVVHGISTISPKLILKKITVLNDKKLMLRLRESLRYVLLPSNNGK